MSSREQFRRSADDNGKSEINLFSATTCPSTVTRLRSGVVPKKKINSNQFADFLFLIFY